MTHPTYNPTNLLFAGDRYGYVTIFDMNKRNMIVKREIAAERRVTGISVISHKYEDTDLITFSVVLHAHKEVYIYRMRTSDNKPVHCFTIVCARNIQAVTEGTKASEMPYKSILAPDGRYISVILYNGSVEVYRIPDPPAVLPGTQVSEPSSINLKIPVKNTLTVPGMNPVPQIKTPERISPVNSKEFPKGSLAAGSLGSLGGEVKELKKMKTIALKSPEVDKNIEEKLFALVLGEVPAGLQPVEEKKVNNVTTTVKDAKKAGKGGKEEKEIEKTIPPEFFQKKFEQNEEQVYQKFERSPETGDISEDLEPPKYYPFLFYGQSSIIIQDNSKKQLGIEKTAYITTNIVCVWKQHKLIETYTLETPTKDDVPLYMLNNLFPKPEKGSESSRSNLGSIDEVLKESAPSKSTTTPQTQNQGQPQGQNQTQALPGKDKKAVPENDVEALQPSASLMTIYPISCATINKSLSFLAVGMVDGSVVVYDLLIQAEKQALDRHLSEVTQMEFFEDWRLITGSKDGGVNLYDLQDISKTKKYEHVYKVKGNSIVSIQVNEAGMAFVLDNKRNFRTYDLYHFEKIFKVFPGVVMGKKYQFSLSPYPIIDLAKGISFLFYLFP